MEFERRPALPAIWLSLILHVSKTWLIWIFWIMILIYIYKGIVLPYGPYFGLDITFYIVWGLTTVFRHLIGVNGLARCEPVALILFAVICAFCVLACNLYFVRYQTYILRIERLLNAFCMALEALEAVLALVCAVMYMSQGTV